ncbi:MAG: hypothetical protein GQ542_14665 [Desulforhopalus sp.]|nr:hypothetical protein [Desulforhopalus sp.]
MKLIFIYNADSELANTVKDIGHKLFSPNTYDYLFCSLTYAPSKGKLNGKLFGRMQRLRWFFSILMNLKSSMD